MEPQSLHDTVEFSKTEAHEADLAAAGCAGDFLLAQAVLPHSNSQDIGILLIHADRLYWRFRRDCAECFASEADWFKELPEYIRQIARQLGAQKCVEWLESTLSHMLRISARSPVLIEHSASMTVNRLYSNYIQPTVLPYRTHLPQYSMDGASIQFGSHRCVEPECWVEVFTDLALTDDMFIVRLDDQSIVPGTEDASRCAFRSKVLDPWDGKRLLLKRNSESAADNYAVEFCYRLGIAGPNVESDLARPPGSITLRPSGAGYGWLDASGNKIEVLGEFLFVI